MNICVACGGTGGHIFPGLATAQELRTRGHNITLWLAGRSVETSSIDGWDGATVSVQASGFPSGISLKAISTTFRLCHAVFLSWLKMRKMRPDAVLAMGSYASVGPVIAAHLCHIPVILHEANAVPGRAISFLSRFATSIGIAFPDAASHLNAEKTSVTGFPLRKTFSNINHTKSDKFTLLIIGGSQGAHIFNEMFPEAIEALYKQNIHLKVMHLAGMHEADVVEKRYKDANIEAEVYAFSHDIASIYAKTDFVIARAGAATCTELAICGLPALLVPHPTAARNHQMLNAMSMAKQGGMSVQPQQDMTIEWLVNYLKNLIENDDITEIMRTKLKNSAIGNGTELLANLVEQVKYPD